MKTTKVIQFHRPKKKKKQIINVDGIKYFTGQQIKALRRTVRDKASLGKLTGIREWILIDLLTSSGLRVSEASNLRCGDLKAGYGESSLFVREGKGSRSRTVVIPDGLKKHLKSFLKWKQDRNEPTGNDDFLFLGQRGVMGVQAIQQIVKKYLKLLDLYESGKSVHALRHSYAVELYRHERDIRAVQRQLGHASIQTTQLYADVTKEDIQGQVKGLWN
jgi:integrase/recombinase XerD